MSNKIVGCQPKDKPRERSDCDSCGNKYNDAVCIAARKQEVFEIIFIKEDNDYDLILEVCGIRDIKQRTTILIDEGRPKKREVLGVLRTDDNAEMRV